MVITLRISDNFNPEVREPVITSLICFDPFLNLFRKFERLVLEPSVALFSPKILPAV